MGCMRYLVHRAVEGRLVGLGRAVEPDSLRTNCSAEARISSFVAGGAKLCRVLMLRHMGVSGKLGVSRELPVSMRFRAGPSHTMRAAIKARCLPWPRMHRSLERLRARLDAASRHGRLAQYEIPEESHGQQDCHRRGGAVGGYAGAHMVQAGEDVTFIDLWPEHVEHMKQHGLAITHAKDGPFTVPVRALHITELQQLAKEKPVDIAFVCTKSYDTAWATAMIKQYLAPDGYCRVAAELHERGDDRRHRRLGQDAGLDRQLDHRRTCTRRARSVAPPARAARRTPCSASARCTAASPSAPRRSAAWSPTPTAPCHREHLGRALVEARHQRDGQRAVRLHRADRPRDASRTTRIRHFSTRLGSEAIRVGQALGYELRGGQPSGRPRRLPRAGEGDAGGARRRSTSNGWRTRQARRRRAPPLDGPGHGQGPAHRDRVPQRLRRARGRGDRHPAPTNAILTDIVLRVEKGELKPDPRHIEELRLN